MLYASFWKRGKENLTITFLENNLKVMLILRSRACSPQKPVREELAFPAIRDLKMEILYGKGFLNSLPWLLSEL